MTGRHKFREESVIGDQAGGVGVQKCQGGAEAL